MVLSHERKGREEMRQRAADALAGLYTGEPVAAPYPGGRDEGLRILDAFDARHYNESHNGVEPGSTSELSPYIRHGLLSLREVRDSVVARFGAADSRGFVMQLLWRVYWYLIYPGRRLPDEDEAEDGERETGDGRRESRDRRPGTRAVRGADRATADGEPPTLPYSSAPTLPSAPGPTHFYCIDEPLRELKATGYLTYQARLWVASHLVHQQGIDWREGSRLFMEHLVDADPVVNELSWRWVAGELTGQPYFFNQARVKDSTRGEYCARCKAYRCPFEGSVDAVEERLHRGGGAPR